MICRYPVPLYKNEGGKKRVIYVPCNKCAWCKRRLRNEWFVRFVEESKQHFYTRFVTLDYSDEFLPFKFEEETGELIPSVNLRDIQLYHKKIRDHYKFRFFLASEYGRQNGRPHYHAIYWSDEKIPFYELWNKGEHGSDLPATPASFKYVTKYILKGSYVPDGAEPLFHTMSRRPGIGASFLSSFSEFRPFYSYFGKKMRMPTFYMRKFNETLSPDQLSVLSESKLDFLSTQGKYEALYNSYETLAPQNQSIDDWLNDLYLKDVRKQFQITKK